MPETIPKQEKLARQLDGQVSIWADFAQAPYHPSRQHARVADLIIFDCTPNEDDPETIVSKRRFLQNADPRVAASDIKNEKRRAAIAAIAQTDELDLEVVQDPRFQHWFEFAESLPTQHQTSPGYPLAVHYFKRLFIAREKLPKSTHTPAIDGITTHEFGVVLRTLIEEL